MKFNRLVILLFFPIVFIQKMHPCSAYKVTVASRTMFGINFDTWTINPKIWFEKKGYGAVFSGANYDEGGLRPQSGMNEFGLIFGTLATATPFDRKDMRDKKQIPTRVSYLKDILHTCKTIEEVKAYIEQYEHSVLENDVFIYTDRSGKYLVVEPFKILEGNENKYVQGNFCPSTITDPGSIKQQRYINGTAFLKNKIDTSLAFCTALSDTMHVCREKIGDGTLLTSIYDPTNVEVYLYFYHAYKQKVKFNLEEELAKGDHSLEIASLFPSNPEYLKLIEFKTPFNSALICGLIFTFMFLFLFSFPYFLINYFRNRKVKYAGIKFVLAVLSLCMAYYMSALLREINIFYFPAPYKSYQFSLIDLSSYLPFIILVLIVPLLAINRNVFKDKIWGVIPKLLFSLNNLAYLILIGLFFYWKFYNIIG
jgi:hypothetical protein